MSPFLSSSEAEVHVPFPSLFRGGGSCPLSFVPFPSCPLSFRPLSFLSLFPLQAELGDFYLPIHKR